MKHKITLKITEIMTNFAMELEKKKLQELQTLLTKKNKYKSKTMNLQKTMGNHKCMDCIHRTEQPTELRCLLTNKKVSMNHTCKKYTYRY